MKSPWHSFTVLACRKRYIEVEKIQLFLKKSIKNVKRFLNYLEAHLGWLVLLWALFTMFCTFLLFFHFSLNESKDTIEIARNVVLILTPVIGLPLALWRSSIAAKQTASSQQQSDTSKKSILNERYQKSVDMLAHKELVVRCGGIYALSHLSKECPEDYHIQVVAPLCAFLRNATRKDIAYVLDKTLGEDNFKEDRNNSLSKKNNPVLRDDVRGIISFLQRRSDIQTSIEKESEYILNIEESILPGVCLDKANLQKSQLKKVDFRESTFLEANLEEADFVEANCTKAVFHKTNLKGANLTRSTFKLSNLTYANLTEAILIGANFDEANIEKATLIDATFREENQILSGSSFKETRLIKSNLTGAKLNGVKFRMANCTEAIFIGADLTEAELIGANFTRAELMSAVLKEVNGGLEFGTSFELECWRGRSPLGAIFTEANLKKANLKKANLRGAYFNGSNLIGADFTESDLRGAIFKEANLENARLTKSRLTKIEIQDNIPVDSESVLPPAVNILRKENREKSFVETDFTGSNLKGADLTETNLIDAHFKGAKYDSSTMFPDEFDPQKSGMIFTSS